MVKYTGYWASVSGMGNACRSFVRSFDEVGVPITTQLAPNTIANIDLGKSYKICEEKHGADIEYKFKIIHTTPNDVRQFMEPMKFHIFHLFWETDKLPEWWVWELNHSVDEVWTGCEWNRNTFIRSGVKVPIWVCPQPVEIGEDDLSTYRFESDKDFVFLSIFQWIERKDPRTLLRAYWKAFEGNSNVTLILKTYRDFDDQEKINIKNEIDGWKKELGLSSYPKVALYLDPMIERDVLRLHKNAHCYVSAHHGEGWGRPVAEAMGMGVPVISTNLGGVHEHVPEEFWYPVSYVEENVHDMTFVPWYDKEQRWGKVKESELIDRMREVYEHYSTAQDKAKKAKEHLQKTMNYKVVGEKMIQRLQYLGRNL